MKKLSYKITLRLTKLLNILLMAVPLIIFGNVQHFWNTNEKNMMILVIGGFLVLYTIYGKIYESFTISMSRVLEMIYSQSLALVMSDVLTFIMICLLKNQIIQPAPFIVVFISQLVLSVIWCTTVHVMYFKLYAPKRTIIIHNKEQKIGELIDTYGLKRKFDVQQTITAKECIKEEFKVLQEAEIVFLCGVRSHERNKILKRCIEKDITVYVLPRIGDLIMSSARKMHLFHLPFLKVGRYEPVPEYLLLKRIFDISVSVIALVILSPVMLLTAIAIKLTDGGTVFYKQKRLTKNGKEFYVLKFRSMRQDAEKDGVARLSTGDSDDRVTPIGKLIRKVRIDELPQLLNILEGSMSIVGPRPERPEIAKEYEKYLPEFSLRLQAKAGLTGYAQVYGKYNSTPYDKLQMDLMYIANPNFWEDLRIIFATVKILFLPESTEGVEEGMENALEQMKGDSQIEI